MKSWISRLVLAIWFVGMVVVVQRTSAQGEGMSGRLHFPSILRNAPLLGEPTLENYIGLVVANGDGDDEIYTLRADESEIQQLTHNQVMDLDPQWSPNGQRIAFVQAIAGSDDLYQPMVMEQDGSDVRAVGVQQGQRVQTKWSPDGALLLVYVMNGGSIERLTLISMADGTEMVIADGNITTLTGWEWGWSPDGAYVHYIQSGVLWVYHLATGARVKFEAITLSSGSAWNRPQLLWHHNSNEFVFLAWRGATRVGIVATPDGLLQREILEGTYLLGGWLEAQERLVLTLQESSGETIYTIPYQGGVIEPLGIPESNAPGQLIGITPTGDGVLYNNLYSDGKVWLVPFVGEPTLILSGCFSFCVITTPAWAYNGSGILSTIIYQTQTYPPDSASYVWHGTVGPDSPQSFSFIETAPRWEVGYLPFSSRFGWMQTSTPLYPGPGWEGYSVQLDTVARTKNRFAESLGSYVHVAEWRYQP